MSSILSGLKLPTGQGAVSSLLDATYIPKYTISSSYLHHRVVDEAARQNAYIKYREYYDGDHDTLLSERLKKFLSVKGDEEEFNFNLCPIVVDALSERLKITGFETGDSDQGETFWEWWDANKMDATQMIVHQSAIRDGDHYVMVEWDNDEGRPKISNELACTGGEGVKVHYSQEHKGEIEYASKRWLTKTGDGTGKFRRLNLYFDDHIEKYQSTEGEYEGNWRPYIDPPAPGAAIGTEQPGELGPCGWYWWTDTGAQGGEPLGVPIVHFKNKDQGYDWGQSELKDIIPLQNALNKSVIDLIASADTAGFRIMVSSGDKSVGDLEIYPGVVINSEHPPNEFDFKTVDGEDPAKLIAVVDKFTMTIAQVSRTPISYFQTSKERPAEGTLQQEESGLVAKAEKCQTVFGNGWEQVMVISRRLANAFGDAAMDEEQSIDCQWKEAQTRNEIQHLQVLVLKQQLGVPQKQIWREMGYNDKQIASFEKLKLKAAAQAVRQFQQAGPISQTAPTGSSKSEMESKEGTNGKSTSPEATPDNISSNKGLNGAQITAAAELMAGVSRGITASEVAIELLVAIGISIDKARSMTQAAQNIAIPNEQDVSPVKVKTVDSKNRGGTNG
jgi:hypothetical protein